VFAEPTINDFLALIDWHIAKAEKRATQAVNEVRAQASRAGAFQSGGTIMHSIERARAEFDAGVDAVLGELRRVAQSTKLNPDDLRQLAVQRLQQFALAAKAASQAKQFRSMSEGISRYIDEQFAAFDQHLQFAVRQFSVGLLVPAEPEVPPISNSITIGSMIGSTIQQGSPGANRTGSPIDDVVDEVHAPFMHVIWLVDQLQSDGRAARAALAARLVLIPNGKALVAE
jgi:hypothetical protein